MKTLRPWYYAAGLLSLLIALPVLAQKGGSTGPGSNSPKPVAPTSPGQPMGPNQPSISQPQILTPTYIRGRVVMDTGLPVPEPVSVGLDCGTELRRAIYTDQKGYFEFVFGSGPQGNLDMSASNDSTGLRGGNVGAGSGFGGSGTGDSINRLRGCELQLSVAGYEPLTKEITGPGDITGLDAGTLQLHRLAGVDGSSISVTSMLVPSKAHKEFDKAESDLRSNHQASATQHLEKAVSEYDKYAAAWNLLGGIYSSSGENEKASQAYAKAIASDPHYVPAYVGLASLQLQDRKYEDARETAGKALALDPTTAHASLIQAAADISLNLLDDAEKIARNAEQQPHQTIPQIHVMLAQIFVKKADYTNAAAEMRAYLREAPQGRFAPEIKKSLEEIDKSSAAPPGPPQIAP